MTNTPNGMCQCGCGRPAPIATRNRKNRGWVKGEPLPYLRGHNNLAKRGPEPAAGMKWCGACQSMKAHAEFAANRNQADGLQGQCRACGRAKQAKWRAENRVKHNRACTDARRRKNLGLHPHEYDAMQKAQAGVCAICKGACTARTATGVQKNLAVDHDHKTGAIRGLLCARCNTALGLLDDSPARMAAALAYLAHHKPGAWITDAGQCHECAPLQ